MFLSYRNKRTIDQLIYTATELTTAFHVMGILKKDSSLKLYISEGCLSFFLQNVFLEKIKIVKRIKWKKLAFCQHPLNYPNKDSGSRPNIY